MSSHSWILLQLEMMVVVVAVKSGNHLHVAPVRLPPPEYQHSFFTGHMPFLSPSQSTAVTHAIDTEYTSVVLFPSVL